MECVFWATMYPADVFAKGVERDPGRQLVAAAGRARLALHVGSVV